MVRPRSMRSLAPLHNRVRSYAWGSPTDLADLLGVPNPSGEPQAELWIGAHPAAPSEIEVDGARRRLDEVIAERPAELLGVEVLARFGPRLPFLLKVLAAARPLSLQCHPSAEEARLGFERENRAGVPLTSPQRIFRDPHPKPELIAAVGPFRALRGFRPIAETLALFAPLGLGDLAPSIEALAEQRDAAALARLYGELMRSSAGERRGILEAAVRGAIAHRDRDPAYVWLLRLHELYPDDIAVLTPLFLNLIELAPDEALFLPAGEPHMYLEGMGVELMASSDNVIRGGLTDKYVDVPMLLETLTFAPGAPEVLRPQRRAPGQRSYPTHAPEMQLSIIDVPKGEVIEVHERGGPDVLLSTWGVATLSTPDGDAVTLPRGRSALVLGTAGPYRLEGTARVYRASVPT